MSLSRNNEKWTREEHILAFALYNGIPFGKIHMGNPKIIELAKILGRKIGSVTLKLTNFARLDPALQARNIKGMSHGAKGEVEIWREFIDHPEALAFESEQLLAQRLGKSVEEVAEIEDEALPRPGIERQAIVFIRVNQQFFRKRILSAYNFRCCVTGLAVQPLLVASHIVPWAEDEKNRLNPKNGLCLNAFHDRAFDRGLMWIDENLTVRFSPELTKSDDASKETIAWLTKFEGAKLLLDNKKFTPSLDLLKIHAMRSRSKVG